MKKELFEYKLDLLYYGIFLTDSCYNSLRKGLNKKVNHNDYITTKGLMLELDGKIYVNAKLNKKSPYMIDFNDNKYYLYHDKQVICLVRIIQSPDFALNDAVLPNGVRITDLVNIHGDRIRIQPIRGCANSCSFCDLNKFKYSEKDIDDLDEAFLFAQEHSTFKHALISGGTPRNIQASYDYSNAVIKHFGLKYGDVYPIDVMLVPRSELVNKNTSEDYKVFLNNLKSWHITGIYANLELFNDELRKKYIKDKDRVGKEKYFEFLKLAVDIFGARNVKSCIIIGLESIEDSLKAVEELSKIGVMPVLSPFIPSKKGESTPTPEFMRQVLLKSRDITKKYAVDLGPACSSCRHNTIHYE